MDVFDYLVGQKYRDEYSFYIKKARVICDELHVPVCKNVKWTINDAYKTYGKCLKRGDGSYYITINRVFFKKDTKKYKRGLLSTIIHELIHTINYDDNHGEIFLKYAAIVNEKYNDEDGQFIRITSPSDILNEQAKYVLKCENCGKLFYYHRINQDVRDAIENNGDNVHICGIGVGNGWGMVLVERIRK